MCFHNMVWVCNGIVSLLVSEIRGKSKMLGRSLKADFLKMKNLPVLWAHIWIPIAINALFLSYYAFTGWSASAKVIGFFESVGAGLPILIGIFCADVAEHEQNAGVSKIYSPNPVRRRHFCRRLSFCCSWDFSRLF